MKRFQRINRSETWLAAIAFALFLLANYASLGVEDFSSGRTMLEVGLFFKNAALFFGGFVVAVFAAPLMEAHGANNTPRDTIVIYSARYAVAIAFLFAGQ